MYRPKIFQTFHHVFFFFFFSRNKTGYGINEEKKKKKKGRLEFFVFPVFISTVFLYTQPSYFTRPRCTAIVTASLSLCGFSFVPLHPFPLVSPSASRHRGGQGRGEVSEMGNRFQAGEGENRGTPDRNGGENRFKMATSPQLRELTSNEKSRPRWKLVEQRGPLVEQILTKLFS